jgi:hypothetical protein
MKKAPARRAMAVRGSGEFRIRAVKKFIQAARECRAARIAAHKAQAHETQKQLIAGSIGLFPRQIRIVGVRGIKKGEVIPCRSYDCRVLASNKLDHPLYRIALMDVHRKPQASPETAQSRALRRPDLSVCMNL